MSALDRLLNVTVTRETRTVSRQGFGTLLFPLSHAQPGDDVLAFSSLAEAEAAGFTAANEPYGNRQLSSAFAQDPSPTLVKVGRRTNVAAQTVRLIPLNLNEGVVYAIGVNGEVATYTVGAAEILATTVAGIVAAVTALTGAGSDTTATDNAGASLNIAAGTATKRFYLTGLENCDVLDESTDGGIATDLAALAAADPDFYGVCIDNHGKLELAAAAAWVEANKKLMVADSSDTECADSGVTTDILSVLQDSAYARTGGSVKRRDYGNGFGMGWIAQGLTEDPLAVSVNQKKTWAFRTVAGALVDTTWSEAQKTNINNKRGTFYADFAGLNLTFEGQTAAGEFFDIPQFVDAFVARFQETFTFMFATQALAFDVETQANLAGQMEAVTIQAVAARQIATDPAPLNFVPDPLAVPVADRAARRWTGLVHESRLSGAVHSATLTINLTV